MAFRTAFSKVGVACWVGLVVGCAGCGAALGAPDNWADDRSLVVTRVLGARAPWGGADGRAQGLAGSTAAARFGQAAERGVQSGMSLSGLGLAQQFDRTRQHVFHAPGLSRAGFSLRADTFRPGGVGASGQPVEARVVTPRLSMRNPDSTRSFDLDYTDAQYAVPAPGMPSLRLRQFAPSVGFAPAGGGDWVTLRLYDVRSADGVRTGVPTRTRAVETKWMRKMEFAPGGPDQLQLSALFGSRLHAVDPDSASMFSLTSLQTGALSLGASWNLTPYAKWLLLGGVDRFESTTGGGGEYSSAYVFTGLRGQW